MSACAWQLLVGSGEKTATVLASTCCQTLCPAPHPHLLSHPLLTTLRPPDLPSVPENARRFPARSCGPPGSSTWNISPSAPATTVPLLVFRRPAQPAPFLPPSIFRPSTRRALSLSTWGRSCSRPTSFHRPGPSAPREQAQLCLHRASRAPATSFHPSTVRR